jgi:hypothetical protein
MLSAERAFDILCIVALREFWVVVLRAFPDVRFTVVRAAVWRPVDKGFDLTVRAIPLSPRTAALAKPTLKHSVTRSVKNLFILT